MIPFAGFIMPVRYSSDIEEHLCVRQNVGVFDVSHMGEFVVRGPQALALIQKVSANESCLLLVCLADSQKRTIGWELFGRLRMINCVQCNRI